MQSGQEGFGCVSTDMQDIFGSLVGCLAYLQRGLFAFSYTRENHRFFRRQKMRQVLPFDKGKAELGIFVFLRATTSRSSFGA